MSLVLSLNETLQAKVIANIFASPENSQKSFSDFRGIFLSGLTKDHTFIHSSSDVVFIAQSTFCSIYCVLDYFHKISSGKDIYFWTGSSCLIIASPQRQAFDVDHALDSGRANSRSIISNKILNISGPGPVKSLQTDSDLQSTPRMPIHAWPNQR